MRLYPFVLLVSAAVPTRVADASGASDYSHPIENSTATISPFTGDSNDSPANQQLVVHGIANDEERAPSRKPSIDELRNIANAVGKTTMFKLYGTTSSPKLTFKGWEQALRTDEKPLREVGELTQTGADMDTVMEQVVKLKQRNLVRNAKRFKIRFSPQEMAQTSFLVELGKRRLDVYFNFGKVRELKELLGSSKEGKETLFETLAMNFKGMSKFARFLSIEKQTLVNKSEAELLQKELLTFWKEENKPEEQVLELMDLVNQGWTYETLDTVVEYVALRASKKPEEVYAETIKLIVGTYKDDMKIIQAITRGEEKRARPVTSYFGVEHGEAEVASEGIEHADLADELRKQLLQMWKSTENGLNDVRREAIHRPDKLDHSADLSLDLSLKPPGT